MKASGSLVVRNIGRLLPMTGTGPFSVVRAAVLVRDGTVEYASEEAGLDPSAAAGVPVLDADGGLVSPGLIDCHTHLVFAGSRSDEFVDRCRGVPYEAIAARGGGIARTVEAVRAASREDLVREALPRVWRALAMGVTTIEAKSGYGLDLPNELKLLRAVRDLDAATPADLVATFLGAHALPRGVADREAHVAAIAEEWIPAVAEAGLARFCDCFCEGVAFTPAECERVLRAGIAAGLAPKAHAEQLTRSGGAALAARVGAVSADHLDCATPEDLDALARAGVVAVLLPGCGVSLGRPRFPDARPFVAAGVKVAVSTDFNPGSCVTQDLPLVATIAMAFCGG
ncbi:MAG: imidazolonepropionase, partial [Deltaproteobacteria bacterium]|nr:imidazolonepropionase [Deltaproteobacteria bacterium]